MKKRILLPNGCSCSTPSVTPKNWKTCNKSELKRNWQIQYYFYDPAFPKPKLVPIKGMNEYKDLGDRRNVTQAILDDELQALKEGYNPFLKKYIKPAMAIPTGELNPDLDVIKAFRLAHAQLATSEVYKDQVRFAINRFEKSAMILQLADIKIKDFKRSQLKQVLDQMKLPNDNFNKFKSYFSSLFVILIEYECCETNITRDIAKKTVIHEQRVVLEIQYLEMIMEYLQINYYNFYRYAKIFFYSGARTTELFSVQRKHVRLEKQEYDVLIKKGKQYVWETKIILKKAMPFWSDIVDKCKSPEYYLFSYDLVPGEKQNSPKQITIRWREHVKYKVVFKNGQLIYKKDLQEGDKEFEAVTADFYAMKHVFLDLLDSINHEQKGGHEINTPQIMGGHRNERTTHKFYTTGKKKRNNQVLKELDV